jgi:hypothetical protein
LSKWKIDEIIIDELALLSEEDIADRINKCRSEIGKRVGDWDWKVKWEMELAYTQRELQIRQARRRAHQDYLAREQDGERRTAFEEQNLPEYEGNKIPRAVREMLGWN